MRNTNFIDSNKCISSALELWNVFEKTAKFKDHEYDKNLLQKIKEKLNLQASDSITLYLKNNFVSVEKLLEVIMNTLEPFSLMMNDLLKMFEKAGAKKGNNNIHISFNFDRNNNFNFNLNNFKESVCIVNKISKWIDVIKIDDPWKIIDVLGAEYKLINIHANFNNDIDKWIFEYENKGILPDFIPDAPKTNIESIDKKIKIIWNVYEFLIENFKISYEKNKGIRNYYDECINHDGSQLWCAESDFWTCYLIKVLELRVEEITTTTGKRKEIKVEKFEKDLDKCISLVIINKKKIEVQVENIIEMLNLPYWKKRYEMYSVWTSTQIIEALEDYDIEFNVINNVLSFSFGGSHIATCKKLNPPLKIWAELRTRYDKPIGQRRKSHIQPDYTLAIDDINHLESSVVVIECKQYKKYNLKNFTDAVIDYANGRPSADIILNNYTMLPEKINDYITDNSIKKRISFFGNVLPSTPDTKAFKKSIRESVVNYYETSWPNKNKFLFSINCLQLPCRIKLKWGQTSKDLDLYISIGKSSLINYQNKGSEDNEPYAFLNCDSMCGNGEEIITINKFIDSTYDVYVHNYSGENTVTGVIEISISDGNIYKQICRKNSIDKLFMWHAFRISKNGIEIIDKLENPLLKTNYFNY